MYIKQLEIDNFKSFANKVDIPLLKGFTTISGPNGSGKSNIIDSILFALGLSTSRALRAEKLFHLISTYTKRNEAFVKVTFSETNDGKDFTVARKIKKSSQGYNSIYYMDDKVVTLADIHAKLENHNITQKMRVKSKHFLFCILTIAFFFEFFNKKIEYLINYPSTPSINAN